MSKEIEYVDLVNRLGAVQVKNVPKNEIEKYPDLHLQIVIAVIVNERGEILVQKRSLNKISEPGFIDHICGAMRSNETPEQAAKRESYEEAFINLDKLKIVDAGINTYNRYRYLLLGYSNLTPQVTNLNETEWVKFISFNELVEKHISREWKFVDDFFEDTQKAIENKGS